MSSYISPGFQSTEIKTLLDALHMNCCFIYLFLCNSPEDALEQCFSSFFLVYQCHHTKHVHVPIGTANINAHFQNTVFQDV